MENAAATKGLSAWEFKGAWLASENQLQKFFNVLADFRFLGADHAQGDGESAIIGAGLVGTGFAFEPTRIGVERGEPLRKLRAKEREGGNPGERGEVSGSGIIADKSRGSVDQAEEFGHSPRSGHPGFPGCLPPRELVGVAGDLHSKPLAAQPLGQ